MRLPPLFPALLALALMPSLAPAQDGTVTKLGDIPSQTAPASREPTRINLLTYFGAGNVTGNLVTLDTNRGRMTWEFYGNATLTVANFLSYLRSGRYDNTIIHRAVDNFIIQGGGYKLPFPLTVVPKDAPVPNEFSANRSNVRGTVAMAKIPGDPDSATNEWFVNLGNNSANLDNQNGGFTVFARVIGEGMEVADGIGNLTTINASATLGPAFEDVPVTNGTPPPSASNVVTVRTIREAVLFPDGSGKPSHITFSASSANSSLVTTSTENTELVLGFPSPAPGNTTVTVTATDSDGNAVASTFLVTLTQGASLNNAFANPVIFSGTSGNATSQSTGANKEADEPKHAGNRGGASLWYRWTAPADGVVVISTKGSKFNTLLAVYTGSTLRSLQPVISNNNFEGRKTSQVTFAAVAGTTYQIAVDGKDGASGRVKISLRSAAAGFPVAGEYYGILAGDEVQHALNGAIQLRMNSQGSFSAQLIAGRRLLRFSGTFGSDGTFSRRFSGTPNLEVRLELDEAGITGDVFAGDYGGTLEADWTARGLPGGATATPGRYTFALSVPEQPEEPEPDPDDPPTVPELPSVPGGHGFATGLVKSSGTAYFSGKLGDWEPFSASGPISWQNRLALAARLRDGREIAAGLLTFTPGADSTALSGNIGWTKHPTGDDRFFAEGFAETVAVSGGSYAVPPSGTMVIDLPRKPLNARFSVANGNLRFDVPARNGTLTRYNEFKDFEKVTFALDRSTGFFEGRFYDPGAYDTRAYSAVMIQSANVGSGCFSGERGTGSITFGEATATSGNTTISTGIE